MFSYALGWADMGVKEGSLAFWRIPNKMDKIFSSLSIPNYHFLARLMAR
jgi:hypothetical protein